MGGRLIGTLVQIHAQVAHRLVLILLQFPLSQSRKEVVPLLGEGNSFIRKTP